MLPHFLVVFLVATLEPEDSGLTYVAFAADIASLYEIPEFTKYI